MQHLNHRSASKDVYCHTFICIPCCHYFLLLSPDACVIYRFGSLGTKKVQYLNHGSTVKHVVSPFPWVMMIDVVLGAFILHYCLLSARRTLGIRERCAVAVSRCLPPQEPSFSARRLGAWKRQPARPSASVVCIC